MERLGNHLPTHTKIFVEGGAFLWKKYKFRTGEGTARDTGFIILNKYPKKDNEIIAVNTTTKIEKRKKAKPSTVLVEIKGTEWTSLPEDSIVDCSSREVWPKTRLKEEISKGEIDYLSPLPPNILDKLREAAGNDKTLYTVDKRLIFPEE